MIETKMPSSLSLRSRAELFAWSLCALSVVLLSGALAAENELRVKAEAAVVSQADWSSVDSALLKSVDSLEALWQERLAVMMADSVSGSAAAQLIAALSSMAEVSETTVRSVQIVSDSMVTSEVRMARVRVGGETDAQGLASLLYQLESDEHQFQVVDLDIQGSPLQAAPGGAARLTVRLEAQVPIRHFSPLATVSR